MWTNFTWHKTGASRGFLHTQFPQKAMNLLTVVSNVTVLARAIGATHGGFRNLYRHVVGLLGRVIIPLERPLPAQDNTTQNDEHTHP
jgi:hypothetical protein